MKTRSGFHPINFFFGLLMGAADIVPGVSGGTMALIVGIYERLISSIRGISSAAVSLLRGRRVESAARLREVDWGLIIPLGIGILTALVAGARLILPILERYPVEARAAFFGLIAASLSIPWRRIDVVAGRHYSIAAVAAILAFILVGLPPREVFEPSLIVVLFAAAIAICAMILPGISGSFLLLVMGIYEPTLRALNSLDIAYIAVFVVGAGVGLGTFSNVLQYLLRTHHDSTMAALVGLMGGSLRAIWPYQAEDRSLLAPPSLGSFATVLLLALAGFVAVYAISRISAGADRAGAPDQQK